MYSRALIAYSGRAAPRVRILKGALLIEDDIEERATLQILPAIRLESSAFYNISHAVLWD